jgi:predicted O-methyltransferase YrrM
MVRAALVRVFDRVRERFLIGIATEEQLQRVYDNLYDEIAGMMQIQSAVAGGPVLKPLRHWALSPDAMAVMLADLQERTHPSIVEFGCGQSTVIFASWVKHRGGRVTTYEHDPQYAEVIRKQIDACGLSAHVDLRVVGLIDKAAVGELPASKSYDLPDERDRYDLALIDGPPYWTGESGRYHPLKWSLDRLNPGGAAYLDDAARPPEQRIVAALQRADPGLVATEMRAEKGLTKLTKK